VELLVTSSTQGDEIALTIVAEQTARLNMMNLKITQRPTALATPSISLQNCSMERTVGWLIKL
jgi:hypothetical protein